MLFEAITLNRPPQDQEKFPSALQLLSDTKKRETDPVLRLTHVETLLLLCAKRWGRDFQRSNGVYEIIKTMHKTEPDDKVKLVEPWIPLLNLYERS